MDGDTVFVMDNNMYAANVASGTFEICDVFLANGLYIAVPHGVLGGEYMDCKKIASGGGFKGSSASAPKIVSCVSNKASDDLYKAYDGNSATYWCGNSNQDAEDIIKLEVDGHYNINGIIMEYPNHGSYAQNLHIFHSSDGVNWQPCNIRTVSQKNRYTFDAVYCKYLMLKIDKSSDTPWYVSELLLISN